MSKRARWMVALLGCAGVALVPGQMAADSGEGDHLIELRVTTQRSTTESDDGGFSAAVVSDGGLTVAVYDCTETVEKTMDAWARAQAMRILERHRGPHGIRLAYSSRRPPGNFILDYRLTSDLAEAQVGFWFRSLTNVQLSGEDVGVEPLAQDLLEAMQCVPR